MNWISVKDRLPEPGVNVQVRHLRQGIGAAVSDDWETIGYVTKKGRWALKMEYMNGIYRHSKKPTHWKL